MNTNTNNPTADAMPEIANAESLVNTIIGIVRVSKPIERDFRGYECAAWRETSLSDTGDFPVYLRRDPYNKERLFCAAEIPATITEDFFPSLWCGNLIGKPYDSKQNAGKRAGRPIVIVKDFIPAVTETTKSYDDNNGQKWAIELRAWLPLRDYCHIRIKSVLDYLSKHVQPDYEKAPNDKYCSHLSAVGYVGKELNKYATGAAEITRAIDWHKDEYYLNNNPALVTHLTAA